MEGLKNSQGYLSIILSLLSQFLDIPNFQDLVSHADAVTDKTKAQDSSLVKRNMFSDLTLVAKGLFKGSNDSSGAEEAIFGKPLPDVIPNKLMNMLKFITKYVHLEGIFRVNGSKKRINDLKSILDTQGNLIDWENQESFTAHDVASLLKQYLSELPEPLLLNRYLEVHMEISKIPNDDPKKVKCVQILLLLLPENNRLLFKLLIDLLQQVTLSKSSLMDAHNIGVVFAPVLLKPQDIEVAASATCMGSSATDKLDDLHNYVEFIVSNADSLFMIPDEVQDASQRYQQKLDRGETEEDITIDIESKCVRLDPEIAQKAMKLETRNQLIDLFHATMKMEEGKMKKQRLKKFHKTYPHIVQELNQQSHSPMLPKKNTLHHSLARILSTKRSSITSINSLPSSPSTPSCSSSRLMTPQRVQCRTLTTPCHDTASMSSVFSPRIGALASTPHFSTPQLSQLATPSALLATPSAHLATPSQRVAIGTKRKVFEILQQSPTVPSRLGYQFGQDHDSEDMETEVTHAHKRPRRHIEPIEMLSREPSDDEVDSPMEMNYRDLGETGGYREYFV